MTTKFFNISTDPTLSNNSNILVPSEKAVRSFIASKSIHLDFLQSSAPSEFSTGQNWLNTTDNKLYVATSNSSWNDGTLIQEDQFFTYKDFLYYFDGLYVKPYSTITITEQNKEVQLKTWLGTKEEYDALNGVYDENTIYQVVESGVDYAKLATQTEFNNGSNLVASTPYQIKQELGNYLSLTTGGTLNAGKTLGLTNTNNQVSTISYNNNGQLSLSNSLYVSNETNTNSLVARSGNIYKINTSGATVLWSDSNISSTQLPTASTTDLGAVKIDGTTITINNGTISASGTSSLANSASGTNSLTILGNSANNDGSVNVGNLSSSGANSAALGTNAVALTNSVAIGSSNTSFEKTEANAIGAIAIGYNAHATANNAIQIGSGINNTANTVQINSTRLLDSNNKIDSTIIPAATSTTLGGIMVEYDSTTNTLNFKLS